MHSDELNSTLLVAIVFIGLAMLELVLGIYNSKKRYIRDWIIDFISVAQLSLLLKPVALFLAYMIAQHLWPSGHNLLSDLPFWLAFLIVFLPDDFMHYWYHRLAHEHEWIWPMHRTHHTPYQYQVTIAFRENWTWLFFMPGFWWMGLMIYLGLGEEVALSALIIGLHNVVIHNGVTWDTHLYRMPIIGFLMRMLERVINTPSLHRGHHGLGENSVPFGNYAQTLFIWDQLFGTAVFLNDKVPEQYGVIAPDESTWWQQLWWPFFRLPQVKPDTIEE